MDYDRASVGIRTLMPNHLWILSLVVEVLLVHFAAAAIRELPRARCAVDEVEPTGIGNAAIEEMFFQSVAHVKLPSGLKHQKPIIV